MSAVIDLSKKRNRIILALDIFLGTLLFSECWPTEPMSSYFWRCGKTAWVKRCIALIDAIFGKDHCKYSYMSEKNGTQNAPEYRQPTKEQ